MTNKLLEDIIVKTCDLPTIPSVAEKIIQLLSDPETNGETLGKAIRVDEALSVRVLKMANSSFYGNLRAVDTLTQAVTVLGFKNIKSIVLAASLKGVYNNFGLTEKMLHEHALGTALASFLVAKETGFKKREEVFLAGLLHDIGKVVLNNSVPDKFHKVMEEVYNTGQKFPEVEMDIFGFTHAEVGSLVVKKWNLSNEIEEVIRFHHKPEKAGQDDLYVFQLSAIVNFADTLCHKLGIGMRESEEIDLRELSSFSILKLDDEKLKGIEEKTAELYSKENALLH